MVRSLQFVAILFFIKLSSSRIEAIATPELQKFKESIRNLLKQHEDERNSILKTGDWHDLGTWSAATPLFTSAYEISINAIRKIHAKPQYVAEFEQLNKGLSAMVPFLRTANLTVITRNNTVKLAFPQTEMFENGTLETSPNSKRYLPIVGALYNANYNNSLLLSKFVHACQEFNPLSISKSITYNMKIPDHRPGLSDSEKMQLMIRLEAQATDERLSIYALGIMFVECFALSQKPHLESQKPKPISEVLPHFTATLNLLQLKYHRAAELIKNDHNEL